MLGRRVGGKVGRGVVDLVRDGKWQELVAGCLVPGACQSRSFYLLASQSVSILKNIRFVLCFAAEVFAYDNLSIRFSTPFVTISVGFV